MFFKKLILVVIILICTGCASTGIAPSVSGTASASVYEKGKKLYLAKNYDAAKEYFHDFLAQSPEEPLKTIAMYQLGFCYQMTGDLKEARAFYHRIVTEGTGDEFWIGVTRRRLEEME